MKPLSLRSACLPVGIALALALAGACSSDTDHPAPPLPAVVAPSTSPMAPAGDQPAASGSPDSLQTPQPGSTQRSSPTPAPTAVAGGTPAGWRYYLAPDAGVGFDLPNSWMVYSARDFRILARRAALHFAALYGAPHATLDFGSLDLLARGGVIRTRFVLLSAPMPSGDSLATIARQLARHVQGETGIVGTISVSPITLPIGPAQRLLVRGRLGKLTFVSDLYVFASGSRIVIAEETTQTANASHMRASFRQTLTTLRPI